MSNTSPKIDGVEATFWHVDDIDWTEVQRQRNADGTVSVVREKWRSSGRLSLRVRALRTGHGGAPSRSPQQPHRVRP
jgi:hypothetical protein